MADEQRRAISVMPEQTEEEKYTKVEAKNKWARQAALAQRKVQATAEKEAVHAVEALDDLAEKMETMTEGSPRKEAAKKKFAKLKKDVHLKQQVSHSKVVKVQLAEKQRARAEHEMEEAIQEKVSPRLAFS